MLTFTLVNLSLIALRSKFPELEGGFRVPLYPATPIAAILLNMFLAIDQSNFDPLNLPPHEGMRFVHHKTPLLRKAIE